MIEFKRMMSGKRWFCLCDMSNRQMSLFQHVLLQSPVPSSLKLLSLCHKISKRNYNYPTNSSPQNFLNPPRTCSAISETLFAPPFPRLGPNHPNQEFVPNSPIKHHTSRNPPSVTFQVSQQELGYLWRSRIALTRKVLVQVRCTDATAAGEWRGSEGK